MHCIAVKQASRFGRCLRCVRRQLCVKEHAPTKRRRFAPHSGERDVALDHACGAPLAGTSKSTRPPSCPTSTTSGRRACRSRSPASRRPSSRPRSVRRCERRLLLPSRLIPRLVTPPSLLTGHSTPHLLPHDPGTATPPQFGSTCPVRPPTPSPSTIPGKNASSRAHTHSFDSSAPHFPCRSTPRAIWGSRHGRTPTPTTPSSPTSALRSGRRFGSSRHRQDRPAKQLPLCTGNAVREAPLLPRTVPAVLLAQVQLYEIVGANALRFDLHAWPVAIGPWHTFVACQSRGQTPHHGACVS